MNLSGWNSASSASPSRSSRASSASRPTSPVSIPAHLTVVERAVEGLRDRRLDEALAQADPELAAQDLDDALGGRGSERARRSLSSRALAAGPEAASIAVNVAATSGSVGDVSGGGACPAPARTSSTALLRSEWRS